MAAGIHSVLAWAFWMVNRVVANMSSSHYSSSPAWDHSDPTNIRFEATEDLGPYIPSGSVFEINPASPGVAIKPAYCTVHLKGSSLKLYLTEHHVNALKSKLVPVASAKHYAQNEQQRLQEGEDR